MAAREKVVFDALQKFADALKAKFAASYDTWPEDQLKAPLDNLLTDVGAAMRHTVVVNSEAPQKSAEGQEKSEGRVDAAVRVNGALTGHVELKKPGLGGDPTTLKGEHNKSQWERFKRLPNLIYTDGREWTLHHEGTRWQSLIRLSGNPVIDGAAAVTQDDADALTAMFDQFLGWDPIVPKTSKGIADALAPLCRMMRTEASIALRDPDSALSLLADEWRKYLFPHAGDDVVADAYAQTFTYALLIARFEGATLIAKRQDEEQVLISNAEKTLHSEHSLLGEVLGLLASPKAFAEVKTSATTLLRVIGAGDPSRITKKSQENPWLYFYEEFLASYDPALRKKVGAYYTPVEVVNAQVNLVRDLLVRRFDAASGFADSNVVTLDPAVGTGTYPLEVLETVVDNAPGKAPGALPGLLRQAASNLYGFEYLIGPYSVAHLRLSRFLADHGVPPSQQADLLKVLLADTLDSHEAEAQEMLSFAYQELTKERETARKVKAETRVVVCLGNPPYRRGKAKDLETGESIGGWVTVRRAPVKGHKVRDPDSRRMVADKGEPGIIEDFFEPARLAGNGGDLKNAYNAYVYFWRWALWKVFEQTINEDEATGGVVSFITASSYLRGPGFVGMRQHMRTLLDELWIIDLGGDNKGARRSDNVFQIETPVAIAVGVRYGAANPDTPARVRYANLIDHSVAEKKTVLAGVTDFDHDALVWQECMDGWQDPFLPSGNAAYLDYPLLTNLFPWHTNGVQVKRTWPIGERPEVLRSRWAQLIAPIAAAESKGRAGPDSKRLNARRAKQLKETRDRKVDKEYPRLDGDGRLPALSTLTKSAECPRIDRYAYRSLDRQWVLVDSRLIDYMRPSIWRAHSDRQMYLTSMLTEVMGEGPAAVVSSAVPDLHHFRGSFGGRHVIPLWRDAEGNTANVTDGLLDAILDAQDRTGTIAPEALFAYCYGVMANPSYTDMFWEELTIPGPRIPITKNPNLFDEIASLGRELIFLHTYAERCVPEGASEDIPEGTAEYAVAIPSDEYPSEFTYDSAKREIHIGRGRYDHVAKEVWEYSISGFQVVKSWLDYRKLKRAGKSSGSPLDATRPTQWPDHDGTELLNLLWIIEHTLARRAESARLLQEVVAGGTISGNELPMPDDAATKPLHGEDDADEDEDENEESA